MKHPVGPSMKHKKLLLLLMLLLIPLPLLLRWHSKHLQCKKPIAPRPKENSQKPQETAAVAFEIIAIAAAAGDAVAVAIAVADIALNILEQLWQSS